MVPAAYALGIYAAASDLFFFDRMPVCERMTTRLIVVLALMVSPVMSRSLLLD